LRHLAWRKGQKRPFQNRGKTFPEPFQPTRKAGRLVSGVHGVAEGRVHDVGGLFFQLVGQMRIKTAGYSNRAVPYSGLPLLV
jgi:hypothetical protein